MGSNLLIDLTDLLLIDTTIGHWDRHPMGSYLLIDLPDLLMTDTIDWLLLTGYY